MQVIQTPIEVVDVATDEPTSLELQADVQYTFTPLGIQDDEMTANEIADRVIMSFDGEESLEAGSRAILWAARGSSITISGRLIPLNTNGKREVQLIAGGNPCKVQISAIYG